LLYVSRTTRAQFKGEEPASHAVSRSAADKAHDAAIEALRADRQRRKLENFLKRQPKAKP
jgi:hypothetical protein